MTRRLLAALVLASLGAFLVGCKAAPRTLAESTAQKLDAIDYWSRAGDATLPKPASRRSVALAEVVVEFVTSKNQAGERSQAAFIPPHPVLLAASAAGVGRKNVEFADEAFQQIADRVAEALVRELRARSIDPVPAARVLGADAYAAWETLADAEARDVREINLAATDTGRVRAMRQVPALATRIITTADDHDDRAPALLEELGVDAVLRATIRVGVYLERASLEEGSRLELTTPGARSRITARRSLLSDRTVLDPSSTDSDWTVSLDAYLEAIDATAPAFLATALDALAGPPPP